MNYQMKITMMLMLFFFVFSSAGPSKAGWVEENKDGTMGYYSKGKIVTIGKDNWFKFDLNTGKMSMSDHRRKVYTTGTPGEFCDAISSMREEMMKDMPPQQRMMMEQMMKRNQGSADAKVTVEKMGDGGKIAGFNTVKYKIKVNGRPKVEMWVTDNSSLIKELMPLKKKAFSSTKEFGKCMSEMNPMGGGLTWQDSPEYKKLMGNHWVLKEVSGGRTNTHVVQLKKEAVPDSKFQPPASFKKVSVQEFLKMDGR